MNTVRLNITLPEKLVDQIRIVDKSIIYSLMGNQKDKYIDKINTALMIHLDLLNLN